MPELPEVETTCRGLALKLVGQTLHHVALQRSGLRFPFPIDFASQVVGRKITHITRHAKYALLHLDHGGVIIIHLGMSGRMAFMPPDAKPGKHDHVVFQYGSKAKKTKFDQVFFNDARRFGVLDYTLADQLADHPLLKHMGVDPFDATLTGKWLQGRLQSRKTPMKAVLMDQTLIAGLGNIYVCEALFLSRIHPQRLANHVTAAESTALVKAIRSVLTKAIEAGGSSLRDYVQTDGELGYFQTQFNVYGREGQPCMRCKTPLERIVQSGRSSFFCPQCQH